MEHVIRLFGLPKWIYSDRGPQFVNRFIKELYWLLGIEGNPTSGYHPETNGQVEQINHEIEQYLRLYINSAQDNWSSRLATAKFALNNRQSSTTGKSPFYLNYGRHPNDGKTPHQGGRMEAADELTMRMRTEREDAQAAMKLA